MTTEPFILRYSHNVIEHLGLKLYQNRPTRVIAEIISNSWDADASNVNVRMHMGSGPRWISVADNGHGMDRDVLSESFLVIGQGRRATPDQKSPEGRPLMGRKGIGKLAPFGISQTVDIVTRAESDGDNPAQIYWLRFSLPEILKGSNGASSYEPEVVFEGSDMATIPLSEDSTDTVEEWIALVENASEGTGTLVLLTDLVLGRAIPQEQLISSLGTRFTVTIQDDFAVTVNGNLVTPGNALPACEFRIPPEGFMTEEVDGNNVRYWVGFVKSAEWPQDDAGVGVYAHGKLAQDRPFTFGLKGREIFTRYMYAVMEADWLDELDADLISTDRTSINWEADETIALYEWGQRKVRQWITDFSAWRADQEVGENQARLDEKILTDDVPKVTESEQGQIVELVSEITPGLGKNESAKSQVLTAVAEAWVQKPMRRLIRELWAELGAKKSLPPQTFTAVVEQLTAHAVPESLNLAIVFAQRAFALTKLYEHVHHGAEVDLQNLIERFPWIIEPDLAVLTANESMKRGVERAEGEGHIPTGRRAIVRGITEKKRPDFVFLSSPEDHEIVIVELKSPQQDLTIDNRAQLQDYMMWFEAHYPDANLRGYLVGRSPANLESKYEGLRILPWQKVLQLSRARHVELLAAMLLRSGASAEGDARAADAFELGGEDAQILLDRMADHNAELRDLIDSFGTSAEGDQN